MAFWIKVLLRLALSPLVAYLFPSFMMVAFLSTSVISVFSLFLDFLTPIQCRR
ncbi:MAG: hypothetical protein ACK5PO_06665 [Bacteroidota bacterium]